MLKATGIALLIALGILGCKVKEVESKLEVEKPADTVFNRTRLAPFFAYPVTEREPRFLNSGDIAADSAAYKLRIQHWTLLYNTKTYNKKYGPIPYFYPDNVSFEDYKKRPKPVPGEYNAIMFGN